MEHWEIQLVAAACSAAVERFSQLRFEITVKLWKREVPELADPFDDTRGF